MFLAKPFAHFRRWLHLMGQLIILPALLLVGRLPHIHRGLDGYKTVTTNMSLFGPRTRQRTTIIGCDCGKVFWEEGHDE